MKPTLRLALAVIVFALPMSPVYAGETSEADDWLWLQLPSLARREVKISVLRAQLLARFDRSQSEGGVSRRDHELQEKISRAAFRAQFYSRYLGYDLDGDQRVTRAEIEKVRSLRYYNDRADRSPEHRAAMAIEEVRQIDSLMALDTDGDGSISLEEMSVAADKEFKAPEDDGLVPMIFDADGDGVVTRLEYETAIDRVLNQIDVNHTGIVDYDAAKVVEKQEKFAHRAQQMRRLEAIVRAKKQACGLPDVPPGTQAILVGDGGGGVATIALGDGEISSSLTDVTIEPGSTPLYIAAVSMGHHLWRFHGAVERITTLLVATSSRSDVDRRLADGVVGIPKERVYLAPKNCLRAINLSGDDLPRLTDEESQQDKFAWSNQAKAWNGRIFELLTGTKPSLIIDSDNRNRYRDDVKGVSFGGVTSYQLPSGARSFDGPLPGARKLSQSGPAAALWSRYAGQHSGGIVDIDPATVVSPVPARRTTVLEADGGFAQLIDDGVLTPIGYIHGFTDADGSTSITGSHKERAGQPGYLHIPFSFRVNKAFVFPQHVVIHSLGDPSFYVPEGVTAPTGDAGHACVARGEPPPEVGDDGYQLRDACLTLNGKPPRRRS